MTPYEIVSKSGFFLQKSCKSKTTEIKGDEGKVPLWHLFRTCRKRRLILLWRDATSWKYPVNSINKLIEWKLLTVIQSNETISKLQYKIEVHNIWTKWTNGSKLHWTKFLYLLRHCAGFSLAETFHKLRRVTVCTENRTREFIFWSSQIFPSHLPQFYAHCFPTPTTILFRIIRCYLIMNICIYLLISLHFLPLWNWNNVALYTFDFSVLWD